MYVYILIGYSNWKDTTVAFKIMKKSSCHRDAVDMIITLPSTTMHIGTQLSRQYGIEMAKNKSMLLNFLSCIKFLA